MNNAMKVVEQLRERKKLPKSKMLLGGARSKYYAQMEADDIKVDDFKRYLNLLGYDLVIRERTVLPFEMRF